MGLGHVAGPALRCFVVGLVLLLHTKKHRACSTRDPSVVLPTCGNTYGWAWGAGQTVLIRNVRVLLHDYQDRETRLARRRSVGYYIAHPDYLELHARAGAGLCGLREKPWSPTRSATSSASRTLWYAAMVITAGMMILWIAVVPGLPQHWPEHSPMTRRPSNGRLLPSVSCSFPYVLFFFQHRDGQLLLWPGTNQNIWPTKPS